MKKQVISIGVIMAIVIPITFASCSSESKGKADEPVATATGNSKEMIISEMDKWFSFFKNGLTVGVDMSKVKSTDTEVKEHLVDGKPSGSLMVDGGNEKVEWTRFYAVTNSDPTKLYDIFFEAVDKTLESDSGIKQIDLKPIAEKLNELTGLKYTNGKPGDFDEHSFYWQAADYFCWMEPGMENSFTIHIRKEKP